MIPIRVRPPGRLRFAAAATAAVALLGLHSSASADSYRCRSQIGKEAKTLVTKGLTSVDKCHKGRDAVCVEDSLRSLCNDLPNAFTDSKGLYLASETKALANIDKRCEPGDPVLGNYSGGVQASLFPELNENVNGNSQVLLGTSDLLCDRVKVKCLEAVAKGRSDIIKEVVSDSVSCQKKLDKDATSFGAIAPSCLDTGDKKTPAAVKKINAACTGVDPAQIGTCSPLPQCAVDSAVLTGQSLAKAIYSLPPSCGNGIVDAGEQCDDDNTVSGDGCNAACETEGNTCTPFAGPGGATGTRVMTVSIITPEPLAGLTVSLDYPQFEAGVPGTGSSSVVQSRFTPLQPAGLALMNDRETDLAIGMVNISDGFDSGDLFKVTLDNCVQASQTICNRSQYVFGCTGADAPPACGTQPPPGTVGMCSNPGGCPGAENVCVSQTQASTCAISDPVDDLGQPVAGVTCSVSISEVP